MTRYLEFRTGPYRLLLPLDLVLEIGEAGVAGDFRSWRGRTLPCVDLARFLGVAAAPRPQQIVVGGAGACHVLDVDQVDGLVELEDHHFATLADLSPALGALVDAVAPAPDGAGCRLRLRQPLAWLDGLAVAPTETTT